MVSLLGDTKQEAQAQFARYPLRCLEAELIIDAINKITGTTELYTSAIPEPFGLIPHEATSALAMRIFL